jgi:hypothetical protein
MTSPVRAAMEPTVDTSGIPYIDGRHTNLYWRYQAAPGRTAGVTETKDVTFSG